MAQVEVITSRAQLEAFRQRHGLREDWHEPDEQDVAAIQRLGRFDNAHTDAGGGEAGVWLTVDGEAVAWVNLAVLFALASGAESVG